MLTAEHPECLRSQLLRSTRHASQRYLTRDVGKKKLDAVWRLQHVSYMKTAAVHSRIQPEIKEQAESILHRLGLSPTEAIRIFYTQITLKQGLPFEVAIPNATTRKALEDSEKGINLTSFNSVDDLFESWDK
jgi:DNA-damage-inducible protein J